MPDRIVSRDTSEIFNSDHQEKEQALSYICPLISLMIDQLSINIQVEKNQSRESGLSLAKTNYLAHVTEKKKKLPKVWILLNFSWDFLIF